MNAVMSVVDSKRISNIRICKTKWMSKLNIIMHDFFLLLKLKKLHFFCIFLIKVKVPPPPQALRVNFLIFIIERIFPSDGIIKGYHYII